MTEPRPENPYRTVHARMSPPGAAWDEGFASRQPEIDRLTAERDHARDCNRQAGQQLTTQVRVACQQRDSARAERDAALAAGQNAAEVLSLIYVMLTGAEPMWAEMPWDERCARAANEAQQAFLAVSGSSEPR